MAAERSLSINIDGMSCASCVGHVENALASVPGVSSAVVNLATESALVRIDTENTAALGGTITSALIGAGYPAIVDEIVLDVSGMSCASCVGRLEKALQQGEGVVTASVNLANESASVQYLVGATEPAVILELSNRAGYPAVLTMGEGAKGGREAQSQRKDIEATKLRRLTLIAAVLALPVFIIEMGSHFIPAMHHFVVNTIGVTNSRLFQFVLTTLVLLWPGLGFYRKGFPALFKGRPDMNSLVAVGTTAAYGFSVVATFVPGLLPAGTDNVYYEAAAVIVVLILLGRYLEARAKGRTGQAIKKLIGLQPKTASVERDGVVSTIPIESVLRGDVIHVRPGETLAVDGTVTSGASFVDESMISGEPMAVEKTTGAPLIGGTVNGTGALVFTATNVGRDTMLARIINMVEQAQGAKLPIQSVVDRITAWFVPAVMLVALMTVIIWFVVGPSPQLGFALVAGVAVLIIACPCAMGLATPTSIMVGTGRAAEMGVLFRKGEALQQLQTSTIVALDKTGTLTAGQPALTDFTVTMGFDENEVLGLVAAVEANSEHPVASAIVQAARDKGIELPATESFDSMTGYGVQAKVAGRSVLVGADRLMIKEGISINEFKDSSLRLGEQGKTPLYAAIDGKLAAVIAVADPIKSGTPEAIEALHGLGLRVAMITGDNQSTADAVARELGIDHVVAEVLPEGKVAALEKLSASGDSVAFVGDGINDAPALAVADVGVAIGTGTDIAIEAADVVLMSGDLKGVVNAFDISRKTMRNIHQNLFWAFTYNVLLIPVAAGVLYPWNGLMLSPILAAGAMSLSSVFVISNALRLRWVAPVLR